MRADFARSAGSGTPWRRLVLVGLSGAVPLFVVALVLIGRVYDTAVDFGVQERRGVAMHRRLERVLDAVGSYSAAVAEGLSGRTSSTPLAEATREVDHAMQELSSDYRGELGRRLGLAEPPAGSDQGTRAGLFALEQDWSALRAAPPSVAALAERSATMTDTLLAMVERNGDASNLILDEDLDSYYLMHAVLVGLSHAQPRIVDLEALGPGPAGPSAARERRIAIVVSTLNDVDGEGVARDVKSSLRHDAAFNGTSASLQVRLRPVAERYADAVRAWAAALDEWSKTGVPSAELADRSAAARRTRFELSMVGLDELDRLLETRIDAIRSHRAQAHALVVLTLVGSIFLMALLIRSLLRAREAEVASNQAELSAKEEQLRALGDNLPGGMTYQVLREPDGSMRFLYVSAGVEALHGVSAASVLTDAKVLYDGILEEDRPLLQAAERQSLEGMAPFKMVARARRRGDGPVRWFEFASAPRALPGGRVLWDGIQMDITERYLAEAASRQMQQRFSLIFDRSPIPLTLVNAEDSRFVAVNDAFLTFSGYARDEVIGRTVPDLDFYARPEQRAVVFERLRAEGRVHGIEISFRPRSGKIREIMLWVEQIEIDGERFLLVMSLDVTDQKEALRQQHELEEQLRQTQKLEALGTLAGGIAHDFNNILGAVMSFAELAKLDHPHDAPLLQNLDQILQASDRATALVRQILSFSRRQKEERESLQLGPIVKEVLSLLRATLPATIVIEQATSELVANVLVNATQMHQIVMNLCTNAAHAMKGTQGKLEVTLSQVELRAGEVPHVDLRPGAHVRLTIGDTGHGMDAATVNRIFEPFFTTKSAGEGTGLGLSVVHGIVKEYGGAITVESAVGRGTTFAIYLPAASARVQRAATTDSEIPRGRGERVLLVDDEALLGDAVAKMLDRLGYQPVQFRSPKAALAEFERAPATFGVLVTDFTMPELTGVELLKAVRRIRADLPVIITSGSSGGLRESELQGLGVNALLSKPVSFATLAITLRRAISA